MSELGLGSQAEGPGDGTKRPPRRHYRPIHEVTEGMVLGEPLVLAERNIVRFSLPAGHVLTDGNLRNLSAHHAEFVCIAEPDARRDEEVAADAAAAAARVTRLFEAADLSQPHLLALFDRVLAYRSR